MEHNNEFSLKTGLVWSLCTCFEYANVECIVGLKTITSSCQSINISKFN